MRYLRRYSVGCVLVAGAIAFDAEPVDAQAGRAQVQEGNRLYEQGRFAEAHQKYLEGLAAAPGSGVIQFNDGNALYQSQDYQQALDAYQQAIESGDPGLQSAAWYNLGNALYRQQQLEQSLEAYKQALRLAPDDVDAKHNLERVLEQMEKQQQDQQQQGDQDEEQDDQDQDQDQQDQQDQDQNQQDQDQNQQEEDQQEEPQEDEQDPQQEPRQQPGQMTPEEAERLLDAIEEDPEEVDRRPPVATGRRPNRPW